MSLKFDSALSLYFGILIFVSVFFTSCKTASSTGIDSLATDLQSCVIQDFPKQEKVFRLAITGDDQVTDRLMAVIAGNRQFRLVERSQLNQIFNEQKLQIGGLTDGEAAVKIGSLLPVDLLLTARQDSNNIRGRFFDVVTGEIYSAFDCQTASITNSQLTQSIVNSNNTTTNIHIENLVVTDLNSITKTKCDTVHKPVRDRFENLSGPENLDAAVSAAIKVRFDTECGEIHYDIMRTFETYKLYPPRYTEFLIQTLAEIESPSLDSRATYILEYFAATNNAIEPNEYQAGLAVLKRARLGYAWNYIKNIINLKRETAPAYIRASTILEMSQKQEIGRPVPFESALIFKAIIDALKFETADKAEPTVSFLNMYGLKYATKPEKAGFYKQTLEILMRESFFANDNDRRAILKQIRLIYENQPKDRHTDERSYYDFALRYDRFITDEKDVVKKSKLMIAATESREAVRIPLCRMNDYYPSNGYTGNEIAKFLLNHNLKCN